MSQKCPTGSYEDFDIIDDDGLPPVPEKHADDGWQILVVDDEEDVHAATRFALKDTHILGRRIELRHAYSGPQALDIINECPAIAVALVDVVMHGPDAGLRLVERIREQGHHRLRIVLRTGQPGYAPELKVLTQYDINDYRTKTELTRPRLMGVLISSLRAYRQLEVLDASRRGLEMVIAGTKNLYQRQNLQLFADGVLAQLISFIGCSPSGLVAYLPPERAGSYQVGAMKILAATDNYRAARARDLPKEKVARIQSTLDLTRQSASGVVLSPAVGLHFVSHEGHQLFVHIDHCCEPDEHCITLLKMFAANIAIGFDNLALVERLDTLAFTDPVYKLPNINALDKELLRLSRSGEPLALTAVHIRSLAHYVGVFGPKIVSDAMHQAGQRLKNGLDPAPTLVATDGRADFFFVTPRELISVEGVTSLFHSSFDVDGVELSFDALVAVVDIVPDQGMEEILRQVAFAMTHAKQDFSLQTVRFEQSMADDLKRRLHLQSALRRAVETGVGIEAYFQPKVDTATARIVGAEALCRWCLDDEFVGPDEFIPIAESSGLSEKLTMLMIRQVAELYQICRERELALVPIAVNLSMQDLLVPDFARRLLAALAAVGLSSEAIEWEITESIMMHNPDKAVRELTLLREKDYSISVDDFGTGYSSLKYLHQLPVSQLKVDRSFVQRLESDSKEHSMVAWSLSIARQLSLRAVAEGVETQEQWTALQDLGCDECQGYLFSRPLPADQFLSLLELSLPLTGQ